MNLSQYRNSIDLTPYARPGMITEVEKEEACDQLLKFLLRERGLIAAFNATYEKKRRLVRDSMNVRPPHPVPPEILALQDRLFWAESLERGIIALDSLAFDRYGIALYEGNIIRLGAEAIVNAANKTLLGCRIPGHECVDNVIHSAAGMQMRADCQRIIAALGHEEECGNARITRAYNLPAKYVIHTVGPMVGRQVTEDQRAALRSSYIAALNLAEEMNLHSIAFCCVGTGVFNFPADEAAEIATGAVLGWKLRHEDYDLKVIFDTFRPKDTAIYQNILKMM
ncbi:MAG: protein-ADP-ribose hydrolase [Clostridia bacterium]|nr:protein-ADP-ribose hydrolase [Clostridia bacterium]